VKILLYTQDLGRVQACASPSVDDARDEDDMRVQLQRTIHIPSLLIEILACVDWSVRISIFVIFAA